ITGEEHRHGADGEIPPLEFVWLANTCTFAVPGGLGKLIWIPSGTAAIVAVAAPEAWRVTHGLPSGACPNIAALTPLKSQTSACAGPASASMRNAARMATDIFMVISLLTIPRGDAARPRPRRSVEVCTALLTSRWHAEPFGQVHWGTHAAAVRAVVCG